MCKRFKSDDIKLGKIRSGALAKLPDNAFWNLDYTLIVFIRDSIKQFIENWADGEHPMCFETTKDWLNCLNDLVEKFDYCVAHNNDPSRDEAIVDAAFKGLRKVIFMLWT